ncbi:MAG: long-chain fatty acid--CoA ligase [Acidobacteria bacterium]|nr:MAG: long-chain fatty acid--CoA ligase [Acidobacteriota bacterium]
MVEIAEKLEMAEPHADAGPTTLVDIYEGVARNHPKPDTLNYKRDGAWHSMSAGEMLRRARSIALGLYSLGIRKGDRVALLSESRVEWVLADQGCIFAGAVGVPIYPTLTPSQVAYILKDSGARALFVSTPAKLAEIEIVLREGGNVENAVLFDLDASGYARFQRASERAVTPESASQQAGTPAYPAAPHEKNHLSLTQLETRGRELEGQRPELADELARAAKPGDLATIIYTSGTTGEPKGVMLTHANMVSNLLASSNHFEFGETDSALSVLPLSHGFERQAMNMYLHHGMSVYFGESLDKIAINLREVHPTVFVGVPRIYEKILAKAKERAAEKGRTNGLLFDWAIETGKRWARLALSQRPIPFWLSRRHEIADRLVFAKLREALGGRIRIFVSGAAPLSPDVALAFAGAGLPIMQGYGLTETSPVISAGQLDENRVGTTGKPIPNVEVRIASDGEIETRGPHIMLGYWNKPEETRAVFTGDGWFKTGDIGSFDADGFLRVTDRKKELFKTSGGKYISPQPIEQLIKSSRFVNQVVVIGSERRFPAALIVAEWEQLESYAKFKGLDLRTHEDFCHDPRIINLFERQIAARTQNLAQFEKIKRIALLEKELTVEGGELTPTLKVKRRVVNEKYRDVIDRLYAEAELQRRER